MELLHKSCCGLDVHKSSIMACVRRVDSSGASHSHVRPFGTMTRDILELSDWLESHGVGHVAMESTGVYWKPIFNLMEGRFEVILVNAQHVKHVPGRKTDAKDCEWLAELLQMGLLKPSFIPPKPQREIRDLTRHRVQCVEDKTRIANRIQKVLEDANIKLGSVASDVLGVSGRAMLQRIIAGESDPNKLAELARAQLRGKIPELQLALRGKVTQHHRFLLETLYRQLQSLEQTLDAISARIDEIIKADQGTQKDPNVVPFSLAVTLLSTIPGIRTVAAQAILAEIGTDMRQYPSAGHLCSWAGISAGNNESAGKRKTGKTPKGNRWLRRTLVQVALSAGRTRDTYLRSQYSRLAARRGRKKAAVAVAHTILETIYHMLKRRLPYRDLGPDYLDKLDPERLTRYFVKRLERLGHKVTLEPAA
jgi:transposase